jgi:foldase protein PrsA
MKKTAKKGLGNAETKKTRDKIAIISFFKQWDTKKLVFLAAGAALIAVLAIVGVFYYHAYIEPYKRVIITVDNAQIRMDYFLDRARMANVSGARDMVQPLTNELLIEEGVPQFGITVTPQDIDAQLRKMAAGDNGAISEAAFEEWYRQQLNETKVSDDIYRDVIKKSLLTARLEEYLGERMPTVVPQVHVSTIFVNTLDDANKVIARYNDGEDFAKLAGELSIDTDTKDKGGDLGWLPRGISIFDGTAFSLDVGKISVPLAYVTNAESPPSFYYVLLVTEKSDARQIDDQYIEQIKANALSNWLDEQMKTHIIHWNLNSDIYAWLNSKLASSTSSNSQSDVPTNSQMNGQ